MKKNTATLAALFIVLIVLHFLTGGSFHELGTFSSARNLSNLTRQVAINGILAVGMTYVILIGGIDLSVGSVAALTGVVAGVLQVNYGLGQWVGSQAWMGAAISVGAAILTGLFCGIFNGFLITRYRIAPFIVTLGMMVIARGLSLIVAKGAAISPMGDAFNWFGQEYLSIAASNTIVIAVIALLILFRVLKKEKSKTDFIEMFAMVVMGLGMVWIFTGYRGIPIPVLVFGILALIGASILQKTRLGRFVLAIGGNADAAWLAGVPIRKISFGIYVAMGSLAGLCGAILSSRLNSALPTGGELFELDAIAAVVIGGTSLLGGVGTVGGSVIGAFFMGALNNGMSLMDVTEFYQKVIKGIIIIAAVWLDTRQSGATKN